MDLVEDEHVDKVHDAGAGQQVAAEIRADDEGDGQDEGREQVEKRLIDLLEDKDLGANLPPAQVPALDDVLHVVVHAVDEEEVPAHEALTEDGHFTKTAAAATTAEEDGAGGFGLDKDGGAHDDTATETTATVTKEPILRDRVTRVIVEGLDEELAVPERNGAVRESSTADLAGKGTLETRQLVLEILSLLAPGTLGGVGTDTLDGVTDGLDLADEAVTHDGEVGRQSTVVINEEHILEALGLVATNVLGDNLGADAGPDVLDTVFGADIRGIVERRIRVTIGDDENVRGREDLNGCLQSRSNDVLRLVAGN